MLFVTWNVLTWDASIYSSGGEQDAQYRRHVRVVRVLRDVVAAAGHAGEGVVVAVQEVRADPGMPGSAGASLVALADAVGLSCRDVRSRPVVAGARGLCVGVMWSGLVEPVGELLGSSAPWWHGVAAVDLDVGARCPVRCASYHAPPVARNLRADEAEWLLAALRRPRRDGTELPVVLGADTNSISDERVPVVDRGTEYWMPVDRRPRYAGWELVFQGDVELNENGGQEFVPDRRPGRTMRDGGLVDLAVEVHGRGVASTTGHWTTDRIDRAGLDVDPDPWGPRRIDVVRATASAAGAVTGVAVARRPGVPEVARLLGTVVSRGAATSHVTDDPTCAPELASDHLPVVARLRPEGVGPPFARQTVLKDD